jgi:hypothetical protein
MKYLTIQLTNDATKSVKHSGVECPTCHDVIYSCGRHDFHPCTCGKTYIDGGFDYIRVGYETKPESVTLTLLGVSKQDLYLDWNQCGPRKYGTIERNNLTQTQVLSTNSNVNNQSMQSQDLKTAVLITAGELRQSSVGGFTAHDVTRALREKVNTGKLSLSDRSPKEVDGKSTYNIEHSEVKALFTELYDAGSFPNLGRRHTGVFYVYSDSAPVSQATTASAPTQCVALANVASPSPVSSGRPTLNDGEVINRIDSYLENVRQATTKQIQSTLKGVAATCEEIAKHLLDLGYDVDEDETIPASRRVVRW